MSTAPTIPVEIHGQDTVPKPERQRDRVLNGPVDTVHAFWLAGMSCDGCSISATGATNPSVEDLLNGTISGLPKVVLHHPVLSLAAGSEFIEAFDKAERGELEDPFVVIYEGSIADERIALATGGYWSAMGNQAIADSDEEMPYPTSTRLKNMSDKAAAVIAIGTCATWGGIPSSIGNPTNAMSVMDYLGADYRSALGLPVINIPGCAPIGDNFTETIATVLMFLQGMGPLPEFDELGRPAWLFNETVHRGCTRAGYYEEGVFAENFGDPECLVEVGCWGPVVNCNIVSRGAQSHMGGCMAAGGPCIGCTMPGFPDKFSPFYKTPPGSAVSSNASRTLGFGMRRLRGVTNRSRDREPRWDSVDEGTVPSGWGRVGKQSAIEKAMGYVYNKVQFYGVRKPGRYDKRRWGTDVPQHPIHPAPRYEDEEEGEKE